MQQIIEQLANETGISIDDVNCIFISVSNLLVGKVPALKQVVEDVFENVETDKLKEDINKLILYLQEQQYKEVFGAWILPQHNEITYRYREGGSELF